MKKTLILFLCAAAVVTAVFSCTPDDIPATVYDPTGNLQPQPEPEPEPQPEQEPEQEPQPEPVPDTLEHWYKVKFDSLFAISSGHSVSQKTPMGKKFNDFPAATDEQKAWLMNPENEPVISLSDFPKASFKPCTVTLYPNGDPSPSDVNQGSINDCGALAMLGDMAYMCPGYIKSIIKDNADGTYTVTMFDPMANPIGVCVKSTAFAKADGTIIQVTGKNNKPCWSTILEKALFKYDSCFNVNNINGTGPVPIVAMLTGHGECIDFRPGKVDGPTMSLVVDVMLHFHKFIMVMFEGTARNTGTIQTVGGHAYSTMYSSSPKAWFAVRNPWGFNNNVSGTPGDGVMDIDDAGVQKMVEMRVMYPGDVILPYCKENLGPYR